MSVTVSVLTEDGQELTEPYLLRLSGWTEERYLAEAPERGFAEFEDGELIVHSPVNIRHQRIAGFLSFLLLGYTRATHFGEALNGPAVVRLRPGLLLEPDIFVIAAGHDEQLTRQYFDGAPVLVVEVISPGTRQYDLRTKAEHYRLHGVPEYWTIDPDRRVLVRHRMPQADGATYQVEELSSGKLESATIPGFWLDVSWLWREPLPSELDCLNRVLASQRAA